MRVLLSTIGSRGDVQPLVALALALRDAGHEARLVVPPDFREWIAGLGFRVTPIGPELRAMTAAPRSGGAGPTPLSAEQLRRMAIESVAHQFATVAEAARGCDAIVAATAIQVAARSVAEHLGIRYAFAAYCPVVLPSPRHAPIAMPGAPPAPDGVTHEELWSRDAARFTMLFGASLNAQRAALGMPPVDDVRTHIFGDAPWLAADPVLAPWPAASDDGVVQTGAWLVPDDRPLAPEVARFLDAGEAPVYFGFGSMRASPDLGAQMVAAARAHGRRAIVQRGWADLAVPDASDVLSIGEVNQRALFPRVAAAVHHGGAGTTTAAALAGAPQVIVPQMYDQPYFAARVASSGIGAAHSCGMPTEASLSAALDIALAATVGARARAFAPGMTTDGATLAARRLASV